MSTHSIFPLSDQAVTLSFGNIINESYNRRVIAIRDWIQQRAFMGILDMVVAYSSITVFYDVAKVKAQVGSQSCVDFVSALLEEAVKSIDDLHVHESVPMRIPVCYDAAFGPDLLAVCELTGLSKEEVIYLHSVPIYRIYMIGFLPGFPYMGEVDMRLKVSRKSSPRPLVQAGSVGLAGGQTGIYPFDSPGGWQIIGRTPFQLFDRSRTPVSLLSAGDYIQFYPVSKQEFKALKDTQR